MNDEPENVRPLERRDARAARYLRQAAPLQRKAEALRALAAVMRAAGAPADMSFGQAPAAGLVTTEQFNKALAPFGMVW